MELLGSAPCIIEYKLVECTRPVSSPVNQVRDRGKSFRVRDMIFDLTNPEVVSKFFKQKRLIGKFGECENLLFKFS